MADKTLFSPLPSYPLGAKGLSRSTQRGKVISPPTESWTLEGAVKESYLRSRSKKKRE